MYARLQFNGHIYPLTSLSIHLTIHVWYLSLQEKHFKKYRLLMQRLMGRDERSRGFIASVESNLLHTIPEFRKTAQFLNSQFLPL